MKFVGMLDLHQGNSPSCLVSSGLETAVALQSSHITVSIRNSIVEHGIRKGEVACPNFVGRFLSGMKG